MTRVLEHVAVAKRRPLVVEVTTTYLVWVDDEDDEGAKALAQYWLDGGDAADLIRDEHPIDGDLDIREPYAYEARDLTTRPVLPSPPYAPDVNRHGGYWGGPAIPKPEFIAHGPDDLEVS